MGNVSPKTIQIWQEIVSRQKKFLPNVKCNLKTNKENQTTSNRTFWKLKNPDKKGSERCIHGVKKMLKELWCVEQKYVETHWAARSQVQETREQAFKSIDSKAIYLKKHTPKKKGLKMKKVEY